LGLCDDAQLSFTQDRIVARIKTHARLGQSFTALVWAFACADV